MNKDIIKELAADLMFNISETEISDIQNEFDNLEKLLLFFDSIDTDNVEEMIYPIEIETTYLRDDVETNKISQEDALLNVKKSKQGHFLVPKVIR